MVTVEEPTPAEQALSRSYATADGLRFEVIRMTIEHHPDRSVTLRYWLTVRRQNHPDEQWIVALPWEDKSWADVLASPAPPPTGCCSSCTSSTPIWKSGGTRRDTTGGQQRWDGDLPDPSRPRSTPSGRTVRDQREGLAMLVDRARTDGLQLTGEGGCCRC